MSIRYDTEKEAKAASRLQRFFVKRRKEGHHFRIPTGRDGKAAEFVVQCELQRMLDQRRLDELGIISDPPRAMKFHDKDTFGYLIVCRNRRGGPVQTISTEQDETVVKAMISRIEAEGDTILTGKACALCGVWMRPERDIAWRRVLNGDERDATLAVIEDGFVPPTEAGVQCCGDCWTKAYKRIEADLLASYDEWWEAEKAAREASRWYRARRKMRRFLGLGP